MRNCPDCQARPGELHAAGCDVEQCPYCGLQLISCGHAVPRDDRLAWTGRWPGEQECEQYHLFARLVPGKGWVPCRPGEPGAAHDLNTLYSQGKWDRQGKRWTL
jgi:hypothetical protein